MDLYVASGEREDVAKGFICRQVYGCRLKLRRRKWAREQGRRNNEEISG